MTRHKHEYFVRAQGPESEVDEEFGPFTKDDAILDAFYLSYREHGAPFVVVRYTQSHVYFIATIAAHPGKPTR